MKPRSCRAWRKASGSSREAASKARCSSSELLAVELLGHPEVEEGDAAVVHEDVVAGVGVGVEVLEVEHRAEAAAEDDLAEAAALLVRQLLDLLEAHALDQLGDQDPPPREPGHHFRHVDEGVFAVGAGEGALVLGLVLVVELLHHPLADLLGDRLGVEAGGEGAGEADDRAGVAEVGVERLGDPRVLDLHRDLAAVEQLGAVDLADRGGGEGLGLELGEELGERLAVVLLLQHLLDFLPGHRGRVGAQLRQLFLVDLAVLLGDELGVDEGGELAELHRRALHLAEGADHLHRRLQVALLERLFAHAPRSGRRWPLWCRRSGRPARRRSSPAWRSGESALWGSSIRRPFAAKVGTGSASRRLSLSSPVRWPANAQP